MTRSERVRTSRGPSLAALAVLAVLGIQSAAAATTVPSGTQGVRLVISGTDLVVGPAGTELPPEATVGLPDPDASVRVLLDNGSDEGLVGARLVVELHDRVTTRSGLRVALDEGPEDLGTPVVDMPLEDLPAGDLTQLAVTLAGSEVSLVDPQFDVTVRPLVISIVQGSAVLDVVRTATVGVARVIQRPLETAVVVPLDSRPHPSTASTDELVPLATPGGRTDRLLRSVEAVTPGSVSLAPAVHTVEELTEAVTAVIPGAAELLDRLRGAVAAAPTGAVSSPYGMADVPALAANPSTADLAVQAIALGRQRMQAVTGRAPGASHLLLATQTPASLDLSPVDVLVTRWDEAAGVDLAATPSADIPAAERAARAPSGRTLTVLVGDPWVEDILRRADGEAGWSTDAHRVVVESAMTFAELPGQGGRAFVVVPPIAWDGPGQLPVELTTRLAAAPWLRLSDPVTVAARSTVEGPGWTPTPTADPLLSPALARLSTVATRMAGLSSAVAALDSPPPIVGRTDDLLLGASAWPGDRLARARALLDQLEAEVSEAVGTVIIPDDTAITLATERGTIPVTVQHPDGVTLDVVVDVTSQGRLTFADGSSRAVRIEEGGTTTVSFDATALGRGTFPVAVTVRTPEGGMVLARALVEVQASAVSRPALAGVAAVVLLLLLFGRRRRSPRLEVVR